jgi:predicted MPP superfamily phosphohydrolase
MTDMDGMQLVLSRGLGNSVLPVRINNFPEIVVVKVR